jgi:uncharacterized membrane protein YeaQ/YmgE (transglycosylase-associated protein family)
VAFAVGFLIWFLVGIAAGFIMPRAYKAAGAEPVMAIVFGVCGAFIGGMLGSSAHVFHDATPLRIGGLIGCVSGSLFFTFLYNFVARRLV